MTPIATSPDGQRGRTAYRVYLAANAATFFALHTVYTMAAVYYVRVVGMSPLQLVLVGTALEVGYFAFEVPTGVVADAYSRKWSVIAGTALLGAGFIVQGVVPVFAVIAAAEMVKGVAHTFISGSWEAWIADEIGEERARRAYLRGAQFSTLGGLGGTLAGAGLATLRLDLPIVTGGCLMLVLAAGLVLLMPEHGFRPAPGRSAAVGPRWRTSPGRGCVWSGAGRCSPGWWRSLSWREPSARAWTAFGRLTC